VTSRDCIKARRLRVEIASQQFLRAFSCARRLVHDRAAAMPH